MTTRVAWPALALVVALVGCAKQEDEAKPAAGPDHSIPVEEAARGVTACQAWADQVCACADKEPSLAAACTEAKPIVDAFKMSVRTANAKSVEGEVRARLQREARRIAARCFESSANFQCAAPAAPAAE